MNRNIHFTTDLLVLTQRLNLGILLNLSHDDNEIVSETTKVLTVYKYVLKSTLWQVFYVNAITYVSLLRSMSTSIEKFTISVQLSKVYNTRYQSFVNVKSLQHIYHFSALFKNWAVIQF